MMCWRIHLFLLVALVQVFHIAALTNPNDLNALNSLKDVWTNIPPNWDGADPCGSRWDGISCSNDRVLSITLASINLTGTLSSDITGLSELQTLDLSHNKGMTGPLPTSIGDLKNLASLMVVGCGFSGQIPPSIGSLHKLVMLSLNLNNFIGEIPASIGDLSELILLDLGNNKLSGRIPVSKGSTPGLDMLVKTKHFHLGNNHLSGEIPSQLFSSNMELIHLLLDNNRLTGSIPSSLGLVQRLEVVRLDRNALTGPVPENLNNLTSVQHLDLSNNKLTGPLPNLTGMDTLNNVDISNNSFDATDVPPWFSSLPTLTSLTMEGTQIRGQLPVSLFSLYLLQTVALKNNLINGTLDIGRHYSNQLKLIDLENNSIEDFVHPANCSFPIILVGNPICADGEEEKYCTQSNPSYSSMQPPENCTPDHRCSSEKTISSPNCKCSCPYSGNLFFRAPSFSNFENQSVFESLAQELLTSFKSNNHPVDSVSLTNPVKNTEGYLILTLQVFPSGQDYFNRTGISGIGLVLNALIFQPSNSSGFGSYYFDANSYPCFQGLGKSSRTAVIIGEAIGGSILLLLLLSIGVYAFYQKKRAKRASKKNQPFASWDLNSDSGGVPQLKGIRCFSFEEIKKCTNNFSKMNDIGSGGYGKVYRGTLPNGVLVAIKRAQQGSTQGGLQFKAEIELLSRVHHKNVVNLVGFCFHQGEQMLVYEYIMNGSLKDSLTGKTGIRLDWVRRLQIALGAARGVHYLHELANPPIIHRDIKSNNILLDERLNAKVADFGLSKPMGELERSHVTTQVKGTMGYLDPEYYLTQQLTKKSDVYSFGVLLLELLTARSPIVKGKYIVQEVKEAIDKSKGLYNLKAMLDPMVASTMALASVERFVDLAVHCLQELPINRPTMSEVVKEIETIMEMAGLNPNIESTSTSDNYEGASTGSNQFYSNENLDAYSKGYSPTKSDGK